MLMALCSQHSGVNFIWRAYQQLRRQDSLRCRGGLPPRGGAQDPLVLLHYTALQHMHPLVGQTPCACSVLLVRRTSHKHCLPSKSAA